LKYNLPDTLVSEYIEFDRLFRLGSTRTSSGDTTFTSTSSTQVYSTTTFSGGLYAGRGENGMLQILASVLTDYIITATDYNNKLEQDALNNFINDYNIHIDNFNNHIISLASKTEVGHIKLATFPEVTTGTNDTSAVTPAGLKIELDKKISNAGNTPSIQSGAESNLPSAGISGRIYITTDTGKILQDNGSSWDMRGGFSQVLYELDANNSKFSGTKKDDTLCWSGKCISANTSTTSAVELTQTTITVLRPFQYALAVRLKSANSSYSTNAIKIDVQKNVSGTFTSISTSYIKANEFTNTTDYKCFYMHFDYTGSKAVNNELKVIITLQAQSTAYEIDLDSIVIMPVGLGGFEA
jgi:hypothetical protein